ncbi:MAG: hypothetical protein K1X66_01460 [Verrucomicrobiae bacterium]|nr:hypothetical protein [Verrucomicrobiae bacterium]
MKQHVNLTLDPKVTQRAKYLARERNTSVSALVEDLLSQASTGTRRKRKNSQTFTTQWKGRLALAGKREKRYRALAKHYDLE